MERPVSSMNQETNRFLNRLKTELLTQYREEYLRKSREVEILSSRDLSLLPNAAELQQKIISSQDDAATQEKQAEAVQLFPNAVEQVIRQRVELPMPNFLVGVLVRPSNRYVIETINELVDEEGNPLDHTAIGPHERAVGQVTFVFPGRQFQINVKYGQKEHEGAGTSATNEPTKITLSAFGHNK
jgi:hypothetical protein